MFKNLQKHKSRKLQLFAGCKMFSYFVKFGKGRGEIIIIGARRVVFGFENFCD